MLLSKIVKTKYILFFIILTLAAFVRFDRIATQSPLIADQGRDYLAAIDTIETGKLPLLGIPSSVPRFHQGPVYIWFLAIIFQTFGLNPIYPAVFASTLGLLTVGLTYIFLDKHTNTLIASISSLIIAISPFAIAESRMAFHTNAIPFFSIIYLYTLIKFIKQKTSIFWPVLAFALLFQFELVVAPLILLIPIAFGQAKLKLTQKHLFHSLTAIFIGLLPQIVYDITHNFKQVGLFIVWVGYRISSFLGFFQEHAASSTKITHVASNIFSYFQRYFSWPYSFPTWGYIALLILGVIYAARQSSRTLTRTIIDTKSPQSLMLLVYSWICLMILSFFVLGNASTAYFPVLFIPLAVSIGLVVSLVKPSSLRLFVVALIITNSISNIVFVTDHDYLTGPTRAGNPLFGYGTSLAEQQQIVDFIVNKTTSPDLIAIGPGSQFTSHLDGYKYLLKQRHQIESVPTGVSVWIQPQYVKTMPKDSVNYQFQTMVISLPLR